MGTIIFILLDLFVFGSFLIRNSERHVLFAETCRVCLDGEASLSRGSQRLGTEAVR